MTYTQIHEARWNGSGEDLPAHAKAYIESLPEPDRTVYKIVDTLLSRKGFEYWWEPDAGGMDTDSNDEIFEEIKRIIEERK